MKLTFSILLGWLFCLNLSGQKLIALSPVQGDNYDMLQNAIDFAIKNPGNSISLAPGIYNYSKPLLAVFINGKDYGQVSFLMTGPQNAKNAPDGRVAILAPSFNNAPAISIQKGKGVTIQNIYFRGKYTLPNTLDPYKMQIMRYADWDDHQSRQDHLTPYAGAAIDPFTDPDLGFKTQYPGLEKYYLKGMSRGGSTGVDFIGCRFTNFVVGIIYEPEGQQNGDMCNVIDCAIEYCKVALAWCQDQTKGNHVERFRCWGNTHTVFDCNLFGRGIGAMPFIRGANIAGGVYQVFNCFSAGRFTGSASEIYAEMIFKIGNIGGSPTPTVENMTVDLMDFGWAPDYIVFGNANFIGCQIRIYNGQKNRINLAGFAGKFVHGAMERPITTAVLNAGQFIAQPTFDNVTMMDENAQGGLPIRMQASSEKKIYLGQRAVTLVPTQYKATMSAKGLQQGDYVMAGEEPTKFYDSAILPFNISSIQVGRVISIKDDVATLDQVSILVKSGKLMQLYVIR
jgi:hypothetical protein